MIHVFLLMVYLGIGDDRRLISDNMYFRSIDDCNYFASKVSKRYGTIRLDFLDPKDRITAYCLPKYIDEKTLGIEIY